MLGLLTKDKLGAKLFNIMLGSVLLLAIINFLLKAPYIIKTTFYDAFRFINTKYVIHQMADSKSLSSQQVLLFFEEQDADVAPIVMSIADEFFHQVNDRFSFKSNKDIPIIIHPDKESLNSRFGWDADESAMGVYWAGVIRVLSPKVWIKEQDPRLMWELYRYGGPVVHEYIHYVVDEKTKGNYTRWFTEALAQYWERELTGFQFDSSEGCLTQELYPLSQMDRQFDSLPNQALAYRQSLAAAEYIYHFHSQREVDLLLGFLGKGMSLSQGMEQAFGYTLKEFEERLTSWIREGVNLNKAS